MERNIFKISICCLALSLATTGQAQQKQKDAIQFSKLKRDSHNIIPCAATEYDTYLQKKHPKKLSGQEFENWIAPKVQEVRHNLQAKNTNNIITIPIVFHVIHDGDAIGTDENVPDEQLLSQLEVLNQDFRRILGTPGYNTHPDGADIELEFCLAQRDPNGNPTTGIDRVNLNQFSWNSFEEIDGILKAETQWDPELYLNIWICKMGGEMDGIGGFAYFPDASGLEGFEGSEATAEIDGVVLSYLGVGSVDLYPEGNYMPGRDTGRSATHELGHFFGLRHIWGDGEDCSATDYCADTPPAAELNFFCDPIDTCPEDESPDMIENHMDYTMDECKNIFTQGQKERVWTVLANSPRRIALTNSDSCVYPEELDWDGSLKINGFDIACANDFTSSVTLSNKGNNTITSAAITYRIDDEPTQTYNWTGSLAPDATTEITLELTAQAGNHILYLDMISANGNADEYNHNDLKSKVFKMTGDYETDQVELSIIPDAFGSEITWRLEDSNENVLYSGGPYEDFDDTPIFETFNLTNGCYTFIIEDGFGDGICCQSGDGSYELKTAEGITIGTGGAYGLGEKAAFEITGNLDIAKNDIETGLTLYPNPVKDLLHITSNTSNTKGNYTIYNTLGQNVLTGEISFNTDFTINTSALSPGIYSIKIIKEDKVKSWKFIKE